MATVISSNSIESHSINKYNFKVISMGQKTKDGASNSERSGEVFTKEHHPAKRASDIDSSAMSQSSKDSLIESLMKKTDEMSSNFIKLQMKLEQKEEEYQTQLQQIKEQSFAEGIEKGKLQAIETTNQNSTDAVAQFSSSIVKLEESAKEFENALEVIKSDLMHAALDISKEVVHVELSQNSSEIATLLANELIKELQSASKITLKVNPNDHGNVSQQIGSLEHIEIISDSAVNLGGVIAISDAGNIDSQISKRFERVKRAALSE